MLNDNAQMVFGQSYTAHFTADGLLGVVPDANAVHNGFVGDSNFSDVGYNSSKNGIDLTFSYAGHGSSVGSAGKEMESVINDNRNIWAGTVTYSGMDSGTVVDKSSPTSTSNIILWSLGGVIALVLLLVILETEEKL